LKNSVALNFQVIKNTRFERYKVRNFRNSLVLNAFKYIMKERHINDLGEFDLFNNILLAADGSEHSLRAAEKAIKLAKNNSEAKIVVLYVVTSATSKSDVLHNLDSQGIAKQRQDKMLSIEEKAKNAGVNYEVKMIRGEEPGPAIVKFANENNSDIVVIGSRGLNALQEMLLGSVSHKVAKRANCPVMIVK
jgi:nucleotide-binding universal stress UspA family protein